HAFAGEPVFLANTVATTIPSLGPVDGLLTRSGWDDGAEAVEIFLGEIPSFRAIDDARHPDALARVKAIAGARADSKNTFVRASEGAKLVEYFERWVEYTTYLRCAAALLQVAAVEAASGAVPMEAPDFLRAPELLDPYTGAPLRWDRSAEALVIRSVGAD